MIDTPAGASIHLVETFIVSLPRDVPYLGPLGPGEEVNARGYFIRRGNRMRCEAGYYRLPEGMGLGVEPVAEFWKYVIGK